MKIAAGSKRRVLASLVAAACAWASPAGAIPLLNGFGGAAGYGASVLPFNDDGSSAAIDIRPSFPRGVNFFGAVYTTMWVNNNGDVSFRGAIPDFTPAAFPIADQPMIAPWWGDVDTRGADRPARAGVYWHLEARRIVATWFTVGYYDRHHDKLNSFQLVLTPAGACDDGDFDVEFRYARCEWTTGDASGGARGLGGTEAQAGFDAGNRRDFVMLPGSRTPRVLNLCTGTNAGRPGLWRFQVRNGRVAGGCEGAGVPCATGRMGACAAGHTVCAGAATACVGDVEPAAERCDGFDNDCDTVVDDGAGLCPGTQVCDRGTCVDRCLPELGCFEGEVCSDRGTCVPSACATVTCPVGERCVAGRCAGPCTDVTCPHGQVCRAGRCADPCAGITCGANQVCVGGQCARSCLCRPCDAGQTCGRDGRCVPTACATVTCPAGAWCSAGRCADACEGARCPEGERCAMGSCVRVAVMDGGVADGGRPLVDAGGADARVGADAEAIHDAGADASALDGGLVDVTAPGDDAASPEPPPEGCACRTTRTRRSPPVAALVALALALGARRRGRSRAPAS